MDNKKEILMRIADKVTTTYYRMYLIRATIMVVLGLASTYALISKVLPWFFYFIIMVCVVYTSYIPSIHFDGINIKNIDDDEDDINE